MGDALNPNSGGASEKHHRMQRKPHQIARYMMPDYQISHPIPVGTRVVIIRFGEMTAPFIEGIAIVEDASQTPDTYRIVFVGDQTSRERLVFREFQHDPERLLAALLAIWRAEARGCGFDDFFPYEATDKEL